MYASKDLLIRPSNSGYSSSTVAPDYSRKSQLVVEVAVPIHTCVMTEKEIVLYTFLLREMLYCAVMLIKVVQSNLPQASLPLPL